MDCKFDGCIKPIKNKTNQLCSGHYAQLTRGQDLRPLQERIPGRLCSFPGCTNKYSGKGLCTGHAFQRDSGKELTPLIKYKNPRIEKFIANIQETPCCWLWTGVISYRYRGQFSYWDGKKRISMPAHRYSYEYWRGEIPKDYEIDHCCRNGICVNPSHLDAVTRQENMRRRYELTPEEHFALCIPQIALSPIAIRC